MTQFISKLTKLTTILPIVALLIIVSTILIGHINRLKNRKVNNWLNNIRANSENLDFLIRDCFTAITESEKSNDLKNINRDSYLKRLTLLEHTVSEAQYILKCKPSLKLKGQKINKELINAISECATIRDNLFTNVSEDSLYSCNGSHIV